MNAQKKCELEHKKELMDKFVAEYKSKYPRLQLVINHG